MQWPDSPSRSSNAIGWRVVLTQQTLRVALAAPEGWEGALLETLVLFLKNLLFIYLFIFGFVGSSFLCEGFL